MRHKRGYSSSQMKFSLLIALIFASPAFAAGTVEESPVQVAEPNGQFRAQLDFSHREDGKAFNSLVYIIYDRAVGRPWEESDYWPEAQERWTGFRLLFCAETQYLCDLPANLRNNIALQEIARRLSAPATLASLRSHFPDYSMESVEYPGREPVGLLNLITSRKSQTSVRDLQLWDMKETQTQLREKEWLVQFDTESYGKGFFSQNFPSYVALSTLDKAVILDNDKIKSQAADFARTWKRSNEKNPAEATILDFENYMFQQFGFRYRDQLQKITGELTAELQNIPGEKSAAALERFLREKQGGTFPEEAYQHLAFGLLRKIAETEGSYFLLAKNFRRHTGTNIQILEMLLTLQAELDPQLILFLVHYESLIPGGVILHQFVSGATGQTILFEELKAILGREEYSRTNVYARYRYLFDSPALFNESYLAENNPELLRRMTGENGKLRPFASFTEAEQKSILKSYLISGDGRISPSGFYRLSHVMAMRIQPEDGASLARLIHETKSKFFRR